jgi:hypothetical protein
VGVISIDQALDRLLHRRAYREAFIAGRFEELDVAADDLAALRKCDPVELERVAARVREGLLTRKHRGSGGLPDLYPRTLKAWREAHPDDGDLVELMSGFMESEAFERYREVSFAGPGVCLEEAFYRYCDSRNIGDAAAREAEFLAAMMRALAVSPRPDFLLPGEIIRRSPDGFFAVSARGEPALFAALSGRLITGPLTPFLAELLISPEAPAAIAEKHAVSPETLKLSVEQLVGMGLLFDENDVASALGFGYGSARR